MVETVEKRIRIMDNLSVGLMTVLKGENSSRIDEDTSP